MKKILIISFITLLSASTLHADYSNNPKCEGYGILETEERKKCLATNQGIQETKKSINIVTIKEKTGNFFNKLGVNTDSKLFKTGKYSEKK